MKHRIQDLFEHKKAFIAYITAGDPSLKETEKLIIELEKAGVDLIEIGLPFSDSIADGPVIQASHLRSIESGTNLPKIIQMLRHVRRKTRIPIVVMGSFHLFYAYGVEQTLATLKDLQIDGIICPDLSIEEGVEFSARCKHLGICPIFLAAPTSTPERLEKIGKLSDGFVYLISRAGITGADQNLSKNISELVENTHKYIEMPLAVGFGISTPAHVKTVTKVAEGVIVGSVLIDLLEEKGSRKMIDYVKSLVKEVAKK